MNQSVTIYLPHDEVILANKIATLRYESNRKASNPESYLGQPEPTFSDKVGIRAEFAVAKHFGILLSSIKWVYDQEVFSANKDNIFDVAGFEVRSTHHSKGRMTVQAKEVIGPKKDVPMIFCTVDMDTNTVTIKGWVTPAQAPELGTWIEGKYGKPCWYIPADKLNPLNTLPVKKQVA